jgi:pyruvate/2-oxoglutarate dehydrogenase complex dihydrolipoamide acyltransferase (E2) component
MPSSSAASVDCGICTHSAGTTTTPSSRAPHRPATSGGKRTTGPHPAGGRRQFRQGSGGGHCGGRTPWRRRGRSRARPVAMAEDRFLQVRGGRDQAARAHQEDLRRIPHVTNHDECDIADLEEFRNRLNKKNEKSGVRVSMLAFRIKAAVGSLKKFPEFNASLDDNNLILKNTTTSGSRPQGLVVPSSATQTRRASLRSPRGWATSPSSRAMAS